MKRLETERMIIRRFEAGDAVQAHRLFTDGETMRWVGLYPPHSTMEETEKRIRKWTEHDLHYALIKRDTRDFLGYIIVKPDSEENREDTRELGFAVRKDFRNSGYMSEAVRAVLKELEDEGITYVWACCFKGNEASEHLIRKLGFEFQKEGTFEAPNDRVYESYEFRMTLGRNQ